MIWTGKIPREKWIRGWPVYIGLAWLSHPHRPVGVYLRIRTAALVLAVRGRTP